MSVVVFRKKATLDTDIHREWHVKTKAEMGSRMETKGWQTLPTTFQRD